MKRLVGALELLDGPLDDAVALRENLSSMRRLNRLTGGVTISMRAIDALAAGTPELSILDVGTGSADIPAALLADARRHGRMLRVTAVDSRPEVLEAAKAICPALDRLEGLTLGLADGRALPYPDRSFDIGHASLVLHHLEPPDALDFLRELARVARRGIVVSDLARGRLTLAGARLLSGVLGRDRYTRHDAPMSARRAYTLAEARALVAQAELRPILEARGWFGHRWAIAALRT